MTNIIFGSIVVEVILGYLLLNVEIGSDLFYLILGVMLLIGCYAYLVLKRG